MDFSTPYFGKSLEELGYQDIVNFFVDAKEESTRIEFKAFSRRYGNFNDNLDGVIRGICAFLNSEGGILIWGAPVGVQLPGQSAKIFQGTLSPLEELKDKDWLISKISDLITPLPIGINVKVLQNGSDVVYIFEIQPSNYSPHQFKNTYLARLDGQTKPAPHYLIEALFKKIRYPNIEGFIKLERVSNNGTNYFLDISIFIFNFSQLQNEENFSYRLICPQGTFANAKDPSKFQLYSRDNHELIYKGYIDVLHFGAPEMHREVLVFNPYELLRDFNNEVELVLVFGGKYSPLKSSSYKLNFGVISWSQELEPNYLFSQIEENSLFAERQNKLGATRESMLRDLLKR